MVKPALGRRRGTKTSKQRHGLLSAILGGMVLLGVGLTIGLIVGIFALSGSASGGGAINSATDSNGNANANGIGDPAATTKEKLGGVASLLRKPKAAAADASAAILAQAQAFRQAHEQEKQQAGVGVVHGGIVSNGAVAGMRVAPVVSDFMKRTPQIGGKGPFPYYPSEGLVSSTHDFTTFHAPGGFRFDEWKLGDSPYDYTPGESDALARSRRIHVRHAMEHAWNNYREHAFGKDELLPDTLLGQDNWGGLGITLVDALDTLFLMNMTSEFQEARDWVSTSLSHEVTRSVSVFETTIRSLGGLLSAHDWSGDPVFLTKAKDLGERLFHAFDNPSGIPDAQVQLATGKGSNVGWTAGNGITAEFATLQLEFRLLARMSGVLDYKTKSEHVYDLLINMAPHDGLYPYFVRKRGPTPTFANDKITFGAMGDSLYEYMLKIWIQGGKKEQKYRDMYDKAIQGMHDLLLQVSSPSNLVFIADRNNGKLDTKMDHLVCFMGGLLALGAYTDPQGLASERAQRDLKTAKALTYTCYQMYARMNTGIAAEFVQFFPGKDFVMGRGAPHYLLRPETVESFFILYQLTGDPVYREWGWEAFQAIERYCKLRGGYGSLRDVSDTISPPQNKMESFFLAETLKYLYLLFDPETPIDVLNKHVFNTEAHPVRTFPQMDKDGVPDFLKDGSAH